jgi:hypothetical protein
MSSRTVESLPESFSEVLNAPEFEKSCVSWMLSASPSEHGQRADRIIVVAGGVWGVQVLLRTAFLEVFSRRCRCSHFPSSHPIHHLSFLYLPSTKGTYFLLSYTPSLHLREAISRKTISAQPSQY